MNSSLWMIIVVVVAFSAFLMGYAVPPQIEVFMIGGNGDSAEAGIKTEMDQEMDEYYRVLLKEE